MAAIQPSVVERDRNVLCLSRAHALRQVSEGCGIHRDGLANNHAMDFGLEGRVSSRQVLDAMQIAHTGEMEISRGLR